MFTYIDTNVTENILGVFCSPCLALVRAVTEGVDMTNICLLCSADTDRAVGLLTQYQASLTRPEEQALKNNVGKVSAIFGSQLFQALLGKSEMHVR